jgi:hypothetical protein
MSPEESAHAEGVVLAQEGDGIFDGMAALDAHERGELVSPVSVLDAGRGGDEHDLFGVPGHLLLDGVNQFEGAAGVLALI